MDILIIEDDQEIVEFVRAGLGEAGYRVDAAPSGEEGLHKAASGEYGVILLDLMLPGKGGFTVLSELRAAGVRTPVLVASAIHSVEDKVQCLNAGSDDYITKPFALAELLARIRALLRRGQQTGPALLSYAGLRLDMSRLRVDQDGKEILLKPKEFALLRYLLENAETVVTRSMIMEHVWGYDFDPGTKIIDVYICQLREKLDAADEPSLIQTIRGVGYALRKA